jgi:hypothetical protein
MSSPTHERGSTIPLSERRGDWFFIVTFALFFLIVLVSDMGSVTVRSLVDMDAVRANPPGWPPLFVLEALADYAAKVDLLVLHNPVFFQAIMWSDVLFLGPYYLVGIWGFWRGSNWIRVPTFLYASHVISVGIVLVAEHLAGPLASPEPAAVLAGYAPFWLVGVAAAWRVRRHLPFERR